MAVHAEVVELLTVSEVERLEALAAPCLTAGDALLAQADEKAALREVLAAFDTALEKAKSTPESMNLDLLAATLGCLLAREVGLVWVRVCSSPVADQGSPRANELALRLPSSGDSGSDENPVLFFPRRMMERQLEPAETMSAGALLDATKAYVASLERFFPAIVGS